MSYHFEFDRSSRILRACIEGIIGDDEVATFRAETAKLVTDGQPNACIVDLSATKDYDISTSSIRAIAASAPAVPGISIPVIVVAPAPHMFGASRMFQITSEESRPWFRVVRSFDEAYKLLHVDSPSFEAVPSDSEERKKMWNISKAGH